MSASLSASQASSPAQAGGDERTAPTAAFSNHASRRRAARAAKQRTWQSQQPEEAQPAEEMDVEQKRNPPPVAAISLSLSAAQPVPLDDVKSTVPTASTVAFSNHSSRRRAARAANQRAWQSPPPEERKEAVPAEGVEEEKLDAPQPLEQQVAALAATLQHWEGVTKRALEELLQRTNERMARMEDTVATLTEMVVAACNSTAFDAPQQQQQQGRPNRVDVAHVNNMSVDGQHNTISAAHIASLTITGANNIVQATHVGSVRHAAPAGSAQPSAASMRDVAASVGDVRAAVEAVRQQAQGWRQQQQHVAAGVRASVRAAVGGAMAAAAAARHVSFSLPSDAAALSSHSDAPRSNVPTGPAMAATQQPEPSVTIEDEPIDLSDEKY